MGQEAFVSYKFQVNSDSSVARKIKEDQECISMIGERCDRLLPYAKADRDGAKPRTKFGGCVRKGASWTASIRRIIERQP